MTRILYNANINLAFGGINLEENQISIQIGNRPPEIFTPEEVEILVGAAEKWHKFCQEQRRIAKEKLGDERTPCKHCPINNILISPDICISFQDFFRTREIKIRKKVAKLGSEISASEKTKEKLEDLRHFIETGIEL